jgi:hypothetical protein
MMDGYYTIPGGKTNLFGDHGGPGFAVKARMPQDNQALPAGVASLLLTSNCESLLRLRKNPDAQPVCPDANVFNE